MDATITPHNLSRFSLLPASHTSDDGSEVSHRRSGLWCSSQYDNSVSDNFEIFFYSLIGKNLGRLFDVLRAARAPLFCYIPGVTRYQSNNYGSGALLCCRRINATIHRPTKHLAPCGSLFMRGIRLAIYYKNQVLRYLSRRHMSHG